MPKRPRTIRRSERELRLNEPLLKRLIGRKGSRPDLSRRSSTTTKMARSTMPTANENGIIEIVFSGHARPKIENIWFGVSHPYICPSVKPNTKRKMPAPESNVPGISKRAARSPLDSIINTEPMSAMIVTITLILSDHRHETYVVRYPPRSGPTDAEAPAIAPQTPKAIARSLPSNVLARRARPAVRVIAAPRAWIIALLMIKKQ